VHVDEVDVIVEHEADLFELAAPAERPEDAAIGPLICEMIPNGATIQLGVGGLPNAVAQSLTNHRDLGIHTEMFVDSMVDLIEAGVANGSRKAFHPRKALYAFAAGSRHMYDFLDDNPYIEARPVSYVNFPPNIARNNDMISVNSTIEIDLTGQCCSESIGPKQFSGTGGQHDYARGAFDAPGGKSIIAFYSTARGGEVSRVVPGETGSRRITNTWLGRMLSSTFGNSAMNRPLAESDGSRPSAGGMATQSPRSSLEIGVVVCPQYIPPPW
jgi:itaconate CoA-transferase